MLIKAAQSAQASVQTHMKQHQTDHIHGPMSHSFNPTVASAALHMDKDNCDSSCVATQAAQWAEVLSIRPIT